ncbi:MAG TPA: copper resistance system multicopper oxidase [Longimicrobiales bacterium]|nr:copper resistance system multicopper oxidase [Longimicrobiales bacterium]
MDRRTPDPTGLDWTVSRRGFLLASGAVVGLDRILPGWMAGPGLPAHGDPDVLDGSAGPVEIIVGETEIAIDGRRGTAVTMNGTVPGPLLRFREGDEAVIHVTNELDEDTSIHWHGLILPNAMDGVPKVNFRGIPPGETFTYRYPIRQYGTYWYHSHSGLQEQLGHYGPLLIDPAGPEPQAFDREHVIVLSDWTFENPYRILAKLKKHPDYYNYRKRTVFDFFRDVARDGLGPTVQDRLEWGGMRMNPTDISDVTGATYTFLMNGQGPETNWTGLFEPGERVRLRFINASAASFFDVRIPGLPMQVVQVSGQNVRPVETDEFRIAIAETYDVIVEPGEGPYTVFAEGMDRSGYARGTLATREGQEAPVPARRERPLLTMADMGMLHGDGEDNDMADDAMPADASGMGGHEGHDMPRDTSAADEHAGHTMPMPTEGEGTRLRPPGTLPEAAMHSPDHHGPGNAGVAMMTVSRLHEPGTGLGDDGWRVLTYADLEALEHRHDFTPPDREIELHLTGNMERFMWSIDGVEFSDSEAIRVELGERIRLTMVNDTMMNHPMHLHGVWMELENGKEHMIPRVHTVNVKPAETVSLLFHADALGPWAFHCHVLYHMDAGMFRVVEVVEPGAPTTYVPGETGHLDGADG